MKVSPGKTRGFSIPEVLVGLAILGISTTMVLSIVDLQTKGSGKLKKNMRMYEVFYENLNEVKGYSAAQLPSVNTCWIKEYTSDASLIKITKDLASTSDACRGQSLGSSSIVVIWSAKSARDTQATFEPADTLKLPIYSDSLKELSIEGYSTELSSLAEKVSVTLFRN